MNEGYRPRNSIKNNGIEREYTLSLLVSLAFTMDAHSHIISGMRSRVLLILEKELSEGTTIEFVEVTLALRRKNNTLTKVRFSLCPSNSGG